MSWVNLILLACVLALCIYAASVFVHSRIKRVSFFDAESSVRRSVVDAFLFSSFGDAVASLFSALSTLVSALVRLIALPFRLLSSWIIRYVISPLDSVVEGAEKRLDERSDRDFENIAKHQERKLQRMVRREIIRHKRQAVRDQLEESRKNLKLPDPSKLNVNLTSDEMAREVLLQRQIDRVITGFRAGAIPNPSVKTISDAIGVSQSQAKKIRNELHSRGILVKMANGRMELNIGPENSA